MNKIKRNQILCCLKFNNPFPSTELIYSSPFELLIAVLLSIQAKDKIVNKITVDLFSIANTPESMLNLGLENIKYYIRSIGLYNKKAENIIKICCILLKQYKGIVPENRSSLESLPGIGSKVTNVILNTVFHWPVIAVDTHVFRVCNRTHFALGRNVKIIEYKLLRLVPKKFKADFHNLFLAHGKYICTARKPKCNTCKISNLCEFKNKNITLG